MAANWLERACDKERQRKKGLKKRVWGRCRTDATTIVYMSLYIYVCSMVRCLLSVLQWIWQALCASNLEYNNTSIMIIVYCTCLWHFGWSVRWVCLLLCFSLISPCISHVMVEKSVSMHWEPYTNEHSYTKQRTTMHDGYNRCENVQRLPTIFQYNSIFIASHTEIAHPLAPMQWEKEREIGGRGRVYIWGRHSNNHQNIR